MIPKIQQDRPNVIKRIHLKQIYLEEDHNGN